MGTLQDAWVKGYIKSAADVLLDRQAYWRLAKYFVKENRDGFTIPVGAHYTSCATSLMPLPPVTQWFDESGVIPVPDHVIWCHKSRPVTTEYGAYSYCKYLLDDGTAACRRAANALKRAPVPRARARNNLETGCSFVLKRRKGGETA